MGAQREQRVVLNDTKLPKNLTLVEHNTPKHDSANTVRQGTCSDSAMYMAKCAENVESQITSG